MTNNDLNHNWTHPELLEGEVFFRNMKRAQFDALELRSKRIGQAAYDGEGHMQDASDWSPVFLQRSELVEKELDLMTLRRLSGHSRAKVA